MGNEDRTDTADANAAEPNQQQTYDNDGYEEAARGGKHAPPTPVPPPQPPGGDEFDQQAREAANDVRRREHSAD